MCSQPVASEGVTPGVEMLFELWRCQLHFMGAIQEVAV